MAISQQIFNKFNEYLNNAESILELGNQTFVNDCISDYSDELAGYTNSTPVKKYVESKHKKHVSIDITGLDGSMQLDLNLETIPDIGEFDLVTNFGTTEHIEPNQFEPFLHIHNLCKIGGIMIHEVPVFGHWPGHCKYYYDEEFFQYLAKTNKYEILEMQRVTYGSVGDLIFVAMRKKSKPFLSKKLELESTVKSSIAEITIPQYWK
jgi:hypothetical protein